jgi:hypothetical protein
VVENTRIIGSYCWLAQIVFAWRVVFLFPVRLLAGYPDFAIHPGVAETDCHIDLEILADRLREAENWEESFPAGWFISKQTR